MKRLEMRSVRVPITMGVAGLVIAAGVAPFGASSALAQPNGSVSAEAVVVGESSINITRADGTEPEFVNGKVDYYKGATDALKVALANTSGNALGNVRIDLNGTTVAEEVVTDTSKDYNVPLNGAPNGTIDVYIGGTKVQSQQFVVDNAGPVAQGATVKGTANTNDATNTYLQTGATIRLNNAQDVNPGSGVKDAWLEYKSDDQNAQWTAVKGDSDDNKVGTNFPLASTGYYRFATRDNVGNVTYTNLSALVKGYGDHVTVQDAPANPDASIKVNGGDLQTSVYKDTAKATIVVNTTSFFQSNTIKVNGKQVASDPSIVNEVGKPRTYEIDLSAVPRAQDGKYTIESNSTGIFGENSSATWVVNADFDAPTASEGTVEGNYTVVDGKIYAPGTGVTVKFKASDVGSGVDSVKVSNDAAVKDEGNGYYSFVAQSGTNYSVTVTDKVGHTTTKSLTDLGIGSNDVVIDADNPVIERTDGVSPTYTDSDKREWLSSPQTLTWKVTDANLASVAITINGQDAKVEANPDGTYSVNMADFQAGPNGAYAVTITAKDKAGNSADNSATYYVDSVAPVDVKGTIAGEYTNTDFGIYSKSPLTLTMSSNDGQGSGTKGYHLLDENGKVVQEFIDTITIPDGSYKIQAIDNLGNASNPVTLQELLGLKSNNFVTDTQAPTISVERENPSFQNWYNHQVNYSVNLGDDTSLYSGTVKVNGKVVKSFNASAVTRSTALDFSTEGLEPNADGSYNVEIDAMDAAGNTAHWAETIRIDNTPPEVTGFVFTQPGYKEGQSISVDDNYGFFFQGATSVDVQVRDTGASSGIAKVTYTLRNADGSVAKSGQVDAQGGTATVAIPSGFKGYIDAKVADNVANESPVRHPSGVITEDRNWHVNTSSIAINMPDPGHKDAAGQELYNSDTTATVPLLDTTSGFRSVQWGIGGETLGTAEIGIDGSVNGRGFDITHRDHNLVTGLNGSLPISGNTNNMDVWVKTVDRAGNESESHKMISIDKDAPTIDVQYNRTEASGYYNTNRVATVTITERNFDPSAVRMSGNYGSIGSWHNIGGDRWQADVVFDGETQYQWGIGYTDMAGNEAQSYNSEQFTVDKTAPVMSLSFNNNDVAHEKFYKKERTATVSVTDRNFDPALVKYEGSGSLGGWSRKGDTWSAQTTFAADGEYNFHVGVSDKAANGGNPVQSGDFIVDQTAPELKVQGIEQGVSYKKDVKLDVSASDTYLDGSATKADLKGRARGEVKLDGGVDGNKANYELGDISTDPKNDDLYTLNTQAVDLAGNEVKQDRTFSVNRNGSTFKFADESMNGKYFQHLDHDIVMTQTSVDRMDMSKFNIVVIKDGKQITVPHDVWNVQESGGVDGPWVYTVTVKKEFFKDDGRYQVQLFTQSVDGTKESSMAQEYAFVIDHTPPVVLITGIDDNETYTGGDRLVSVEVRDLSGPQEVKMYLNGDPVNFQEKDGAYTVTLPSNFRPQDFRVEVTDKAGNKGTAEVNNFRLAGSWVEGLLGNTVVQAGLGLLGAVLVGLIGLLAFAFAKRRREDKSREEYQGIVGDSSGDIQNPTSSGSLESFDGDADAVDEEPDAWASAWGAGALGASGAGAVASAAGGVEGAEGAEDASDASESGDASDTEAPTEYADDAPTGYEESSSTDDFSDSDGADGSETDADDDSDAHTDVVDDADTGIVDDDEDGTSTFRH